jgi:hypothetical protein
LLEAIDKFSGGNSLEFRSPTLAHLRTRDFWQHMELLARIPGGRKSVLLLGALPFSAWDVIDYQGGVPETLSQEYAHAAIAAATRANIRISIPEVGHLEVVDHAAGAVAAGGGDAHLGAPSRSSNCDTIRIPDAVTSS